MKIRILSLLVCCFSFSILIAQSKNDLITPGEVWKDNDGNAINAHGGGILYFNKTYYWYGEIKKGKTHTHMVYLTQLK